MIDGPGNALGVVGDSPVNGSSTSRAGECTVSAPEHGPVHLVTLDTALDEMRRYGTYLALCGAELPSSGLPSFECPEGCEGRCGLYCMECVRNAAETVGAALTDRAEAGR